MHARYFIEKLSINSNKMFLQENFALEKLLQGTLKAKYDYKYK